MTAEVDIPGRERNVSSYLLTPVTRLRESAFREKLQSAVHQIDGAGRSRSGDRAAV